MVRAIVYLLAIVTAEVVTVFSQPIWGIACHFVILLAIVIDSAKIDRYYYGRMMLSLSLVPLVRIISLSMPLADIPQLWWYPIIYLPLLVAAIVVARLAEYKPRDVGITFGNSLGLIPLYLLIGALGIGLGVVEYFILKAEPLVVDPTWQNAWLPALVLLFSTGFVEEFIFRGVIQRAVVNVFGSWGIVYVSLLFAVLHLGWIEVANPLSWVDIVFVFVIVLFFGWIVKKTGSLLGVTLSHGLTNVMLFIIAPTLF
ncbi:MAG TPA: CPBP family intramembrane metalloprotease [Dehalococcoidia bacterium]|nr:CPBP family intramembrane metalloprotease [Dehalococcoidia bacterium]